MIAESIVILIDPRKTSLLHRIVYGAVGLFLVGRMKFDSSDKYRHREKGRSGWRCVGSIRDDMIFSKECGDKIQLLSARKDLITFVDGIAPCWWHGGECARV